MAPSLYRRLDPARVLTTAERLARRVRERFPEASLAALSEEIAQVARENAARGADIRRPNWWLRGVAILVLVGVPVLLFIVEQRTVGRDIGNIDGLAEFVHTLEASLGAVVFLGAAVFFVFSLEVRMKRRKVLAALDELRSLAHIIDMHQLPKGPERVFLGKQDTPSSPRVGLSPFLMERYLDYCSEMLAVIGKIGALYVQDLGDAAAVAAVDEVEALTTSLSAKIWQKIGILEQLASASPGALTQGAENAGATYAEDLDGTPGPDRS